MTARWIALLAGLLLTACAGGERVATLGRMLATPDDRVIVVAHRGCWKDTAENSLAAIARCRALGIDMVELDVRRTADGALVLMHDDSVNRTTDGHGRIDRMTLAQAKTLRLRAGAGGDGTPLTDQRVPTFAEALAAARGGILVNVDAKSDVHDAVLAELRAARMTDHVLMKTALEPDDPALRRSALLKTRYFMPIIAQQRGAGPLACEVPRYRDLNPVAYEVLFEDDGYLVAGAPAVRAARSRLWVNTLEPRHAAGRVDALAMSDPDRHWGYLADRGVTVIQTDEPAALMAYLKRTGRR